MKNKNKKIPRNRKVCKGTPIEYIVSQKNQFVKLDVREYQNLLLLDLKLKLLNKLIRQNKGTGYYIIPMDLTDSILDLE